MLESIIWLQERERDTASEEREGEREVDGGMVVGVGVDLTVRERREVAAESTAATPSPRRLLLSLQ